MFTSATLGEVLSFANHFTREQTLEAPGVPQDRYDAIAKREGMYWETLADTIRSAFNLRVRREFQERDVLVLTAPNGRPSALRNPTGASATGFEDDSLRARNTHIRQFYSIIEATLKKPVVDETSIPLTEYSDYEFSWRSATDEEAMIKAVHDQLGFVLTPARRQVEILIIEKEP